MLSLLFAAAIAAEPPRVLVLDLKPSGVTVDVARTVTGVVSGRLAQAQGLIALSSGDLRALADLEADRSAAGCEASSCLAEVAAALGARYVIFGDVGTLGDEVVVNLNLYDAERAVPVARQSPRAPVASIASRVEPAVDSFVVALGATAGPPSSSSTPPSESSSALLPVGAGIAGLGVAAAVVGGGVALWADGVVGTGSEARQAKEDALGAGRFGLIAAGVGGAVVVVGAALAVVGVME